MWLTWRMLPCLAWSKPWVWEVEAGRSEIQGHLELQGEFKTDPGLYKTLPEKQTHWTSSTLKGAICKVSTSRKNTPTGRGKTSDKKWMS